MASVVELVTRVAVADMRAGLYRIFAAGFNDDEPRNEKGEWTDGGGGSPKFTLPTKAAALSKMGFKLLTASPSGDTWTHPSGTQVVVQKYNTTHPGNVNLRKYTVTNAAGKKLFAGHQFAKAVSAHLGATGAAPKLQPVAQAGQPSGKVSNLSYPEELALTKAGFVFKGKSNDSFNHDLYEHPAGPVIKVGTNDYSTYANMNEAKKTFGATSVGSGTNSNLALYGLDAKTKEVIGQKPAEAGTAPHYATVGQQKALTEAGYAVKFNNALAGVTLWEKPGAQSYFITKSDGSISKGQKDGAATEVTYSYQPELEKIVNEGAKPQKPADDVGTPHYSKEMIDLNHNAAEGLEKAGFKMSQSDGTSKATWTNAAGAKVNLTKSSDGNQVNWQVVSPDGTQGPWMNLKLSPIADANGNLHPLVGAQVPTQPEKLTVLPGPKHDAITQAGYKLKDSNNEVSTYEHPDTGAVVQLSKNGAWQKNVNGVAQDAGYSLDGLQKALGSITPGIHQTVLKDEGFQLIHTGTGGTAQTVDTWQHPLTGTNVYVTKASNGAVDWKVVPKGGDSTTPTASGVAALSLKKAIAIPAMKPSIPAEGKNQVLQGAGFKMVGSGTQDGHNYDLWQSADGKTGAKVIDQGGSKSTWEYTDKNNVTTTGKYAGDLQTAITKAGSASKPTTTDVPTTYKQPKQDWTMNTDKAWQANARQVVADIWAKASKTDKAKNTDFESGIYKQVADKLGVPIQYFKDVESKIHSWQGGTTANDGNSIGKWAQDIVNGADSVHPGLYIEHLISGHRIDAQYGGKVPELARGLSSQKTGKASPNATPENVQAVKNFMQLADGEGYSFKFPSFGAEGYSSNIDFAKSYGHQHGGITLYKPAGSIPKEWVMSSRDLNTAMWPGYATEHEWMIAAPKSKLPIDSEKGDKVFASAARAVSVPLKAAMDRLHALGWDFVIQGRTIEVYPPHTLTNKAWFSEVRKVHTVGGKVRARMTEVDAVSPPGWKGTTQRMKKHEDVGNPYKLAWWQYEHGAQSHVKPPKGTPGVHVSPRVRKARQRALNRKKRDQKAAADFMAPGVVERAALVGYKVSRAGHPGQKVEGAAHRLAATVEFQGLPISIETRKGQVRKGRNHDGTPWAVRMPADYGYIKGTRGADGQAVDCFVGPVKDARFAYIFHIVCDDDGTYDEDKVFLGFKSMTDAEKIMKAAYDNYADISHSATVLPMHAFIRRVLHTAELRRPGKIHAEEVCA